MAKNYQPPTLSEFISEQQTAFPYAKGDLTRILNHIGVASKMVNREVNAAGLAGGLATDGDGNCILDITPGTIHQRVPLFTGSKNMVFEVEKLIKKFG